MPNGDPTPMPTDALEAALKSVPTDNRHVSQDFYRICYTRCDPMYETTPHIHTPDGIFTVGEELDALGKNAVILNDTPSIAHVNGDLIVLQQTCGNCHTCFVGSQNFHYCPNCRHVLIHQVEPSEAEYWRSIAQTLGFQFCELKKAARLLIENLPDGEYRGLGELRIALK
jgi:hypothetical protein